MTRHVESVLIFSLYFLPILYSLFFISFILCRLNFFFYIHFHLIIHVILFTSSNNAFFSFQVSCSRFSPSILPALYSLQKYSYMFHYLWKYGRIQEEWVFLGVIKYWYIYQCIGETFYSTLRLKMKVALSSETKVLVEINLKVLTYHTILKIFGFAIQTLNIRKGFQLENTNIGTFVRKAHINK